MILIKNTQRKIKIDLKKMELDVQKILDILDYPDFDLGIWLTTNTTIHKYNKQYRHKDKPTDILSFPYHTELKAGQRIKVQSDDDKNLGDIIISLEYVQKDARKQEIPFEQHLQRMLVHGICHLLAYDHIEDADYAVMHKKEMSLLKELRKS